MGVVMPTEEQTYFYRNGEGDELLFVHEGEGVLETSFGNLPYRRGDYLVIPIGTTYRVNTNNTATKMMVLETSGAITTPKRYRNEHGQLLEHSPFCERDIRVPMEINARDEKGAFPVHVRAHGRMTRHILDHHPLDVVGWDGYLYPYALNIEDFRADHRPHPPAAARAPDLRRPELRGLLVCAAPVRLPPGSNPGALQPLQCGKR
jgi:homogentisate 1,2-dioxygenase